MEKKDIGISLQNNNNYIEIDASNTWITPGLIDVQINGYMGIDFNKMRNLMLIFQEI